jgi:hypothetical protein
MFSLFYLQLFYLQSSYVRSLFTFSHYTFGHSTFNHTMGHPTLAHCFGGPCPVIVENVSLCLTAWSLKLEHGVKACFYSKIWAPFHPISKMIHCACPKSQSWMRNKVRLHNSRYTVSLIPKTFYSRTEQWPLACLCWQPPYKFLQNYTQL